MINVRPPIVRWIRAFLGKKQCVRIRDKKSSFKYPNGRANGGIPQGTKLGSMVHLIHCTGKQFTSGLEF